MRRTNTQETLAIVAFAIAGNIILGEHIGLSYLFGIISAVVGVIFIYKQKHEISATAGIIASLVSVITLVFKTFSFSYLFAFMLFVIAGILSLNQVVRKKSTTPELKSEA